ncbi:hypothetical protein HKX41_11315, partial [Salinisphaera sp. USBA-960]|nr:hypothetical protein [Salifodinibacter halophilus]
MNTRRIRPRLVALALAMFGFAAALTATAGVPRCDQCLDQYYACRNAGGDYDGCLNEFWA